MEELVMIQTIRRKYASVQKVLYERGRRIWAATEAQQLGWGGISLVEKAIGMFHTTIRRGLREIQSGKVNDLFPEQSRLQGGIERLGKITKRQYDVYALTLRGLASLQIILTVVGIGLLCFELYRNRA